MPSMVNILPPVAVGDGADRLARFAAMVTDAVSLLNQAVDEIKHEKGSEVTDDTPGESDRDTEQFGQRGQPAG